MKYLIVIVLFVASFTACASPKTLTVKTDTSEIEDDISYSPTVFDMTASKTGRVYRIFVAGSKKPDQGEVYSVVYALDANSMFGTISETIRAAGQSRSANTLVVGIGYPQGMDWRKERQRDLTPTRSILHADDFGGADDFHMFIQNDLKPEIENRYNVVPNSETLFGHSLGGLFALYTLINWPESFDTYVAASPSLWWEDAMMMAYNVRSRLGPKLAIASLTPRVLITVGAYEQTPDPDFPRAKDGYEKKLKVRKQIENAQNFHKFIEEQDGIFGAFHVFEGENHMSVVQPAISRMARFVFSAQAVSPTPAAFPHVRKSVAGINVPDAKTYLSMGAEGRYRLRLRTRALPVPLEIEWGEQFKYNLNAGLSYMQHRTLHEEKVAMDEKFGTKPNDE